MKPNHARNKVWGKPATSIMVAPKSATRVGKPNQLAGATCRWFFESELPLIAAWLVPVMAASTIAAGADPAIF